PAAPGPQGILLPVFDEEGEVGEGEVFAFSMCNPPFFESMQEAAQNPNTAFGGTAAEMVCPGGELAFVLRMLAESEALRDRVHWCGGGG
ncbi:Ribosomal RNA large subunit methyltransferase F, partial [Tetrabaena socialis]